MPVIPVPQASGLLFALYLLAFVSLTTPFTFIGTSSIFITISLLPLIAFYALRQARARANEQTQEVLKRLHLDHILFPPSPADQIDQQKQSRLAQLVAKAPEMSLYGLSLGVLLANAILVAAFSDEGRALGFVVLLAAVVAELCLSSSQALLTSHNFMSLVAVAATRLVLISFGTRHWFIGHCLLFLLIATPMALALLEHHLGQATQGVLKSRRLIIQDSLARINDAFESPVSSPRASKTNAAPPVSTDMRLLYGARLDYQKTPLWTCHVVRSYYG
jgi:hypothetical protein